MEHVRDSLGDRMKGSYEDRFRVLLPRRTHTVIRLDGKAFHTLTRGCVKPFDGRIKDAMTAAAMAVASEAQGAKLAYIQSDEISILLTDFADINTEAWFDGNAQKIVSVAAGVASVAFSQSYGEVGIFDARVFVIPDPVEVVNYFIWRQKDAIRNSVQSCAQAAYSSKQLHGKKQGEMLAMLIDAGRPWDTQAAHYQRGWAVVRQPRPDHEIERWSWAPDWNVPTFTEDRDYIAGRIDDVRPTAPVA